MKKLINITLWLIVVVIVGTSSFFVSREISFDDGYLAGAVFGDSSGYKRGYQVGFEEGYQLKDSLEQKEEKLRASEQFNLNIIYEELGRPEKFIKVDGKILKKEIGGSFYAKTYGKYGRIRVSSEATFARYKGLEIEVRFLDKLSKPIKTQTFDIDQILYPGKNVEFEIPHDEFPDMTDSLDFIILHAEGVE